MREMLAKLDGISRRQWLERTAKLALGVGAMPLWNRAAAAAAGGKGRKLIYLYMSGGMSHMDHGG